jgi:hypothetical protein
MIEADSRGPLYSLVEASVWEFPLALQKWMLGAGRGSQEVEEVVLKACQAWTNLANQSMERVYQAQGFVGLMTASVKNFVQCQRVARDFLESLVPGFGSLKGEASSGEMDELREVVNKLRRDMRALTARVNLLDRGDEPRSELH